MRLSATKEVEMKIAVIISEARYPIQSKAIEGILNEAAKEKVDVYIFTCNSSTGFLTSGDKDSTDRDFLLLDYDQYDGFIFYCDTISDRKMVKNIADRIIKTGATALSVKDRIDGMLWAGIDNSAGVRDIVRHMITVRKRRRIFFIGGPEYNVDSNERLTAYRETLEEFGIEPEDDWIAYGDYHPHSGREIFREWYKRRGEFELPDAIVCANDEMAQGVCREAQLEGLKIPRDLVVSGFDNRLISILSDPSITTVTLPGYDLGVLCAKKLFNAFFKRDENIPDTIPTHAIFRLSTDPGTNNDDINQAITEVRDYYVTGQNHISNLLDGLRDMETGFADTTSWDDFYRILESTIGLFETESFYLFTPVTELKPDDDYVLSLLRGKSLSSLKSDAVMSTAIAWENGELVKYPSFTARELIPKEISEKNGHGYYAIFPLFHQKEMFGYCAACNSSLAYESEWFALFIQIISSAMENLRRKAQLSHMVETLNHLWIYDKLTGVYNRSGFAENADRILHNAKLAGEDIFVLFADLDRLKYVNDNFGHDAGDSFISEIADILKRVFHKDEIVMRYGGDEFVVISSGIDDGTANKITREIQVMIENLNSSGRYEFPLSLSIGYTIKKANNSNELEDLIEEADKLMYEVKLAKKSARTD